MGLRTRTTPGDGAAIRYIVFIAAYLVSILILTTLARADTLITIQGEVVHGKNLSMTAGKVSVKSEALGTVDVPVKNVRSVSTTEPVDVHFTNDARLRGHIVTVGEDLMRVRFQSGVESTPFDLTSVRSITAPSPTIAPKEWTTTGNVNFGLTSSAGNSDAQLLHADGQLTLRRDKTRYNARGEVNFRRENDEELANDALLKLKHDYFVSERWFFYTGLGFEHDTSRDLNLRTDIGTGAGYQIIDTVRTAISVEGGPSYVIEDYSESSDQSYAALRLATDIRYDPVLMTITLFHNSEVLAALSARGGTVVNSRTGARYRLARGLTASAQAKVDWDSDPVPGESEIDIIYMFTLGYAW